MSPTRDELEPGDKPVPSAIYWVLLNRAVQARSPARGKPDQPNTRIYAEADGSVRVTHHLTSILTVKREGGLRIDTGGYYSVSTCSRLQEYLAWGYIYLSRYKRTWWVRSGARYTRLHDGLEIEPDGRMYLNGTRVDKPLPSLTAEQELLVRLAGLRILPNGSTPIRMDIIDRRTPLGTVYGGFHVEGNHPTKAQVNRAILRGLRVRPACR